MTANPARHAWCDAIAVKAMEYYSIGFNPYRTNAMQTAYDEAYAEAAAEWDAAVALWRETPAGDEGPWGDSQMSAVAERFGDDLMDAISPVMAAEELATDLAAEEIAERRAA